MGINTLTAMADIHLRVLRRKKETKQSHMKGTKLKALFMKDSRVLILCKAMLSAGTGVRRAKMLLHYLSANPGSERPGSSHSS